MYLRVERKVYVNLTIIGKLRHNFFVRQLRAQPRLFISAFAGALFYLLLPHAWASQSVTRIIIGWNAAVWLYLMLVAIMAVRATKERIRYRARQQNEGRFLILGLVIIAAIASLLAIVAELAVAKDMQGIARYSHIGLASLTILSSWAFVHTIFALHYAHDYFVNCVNGKTSGLEFPGTDELDYGDFFYFAFVIGTSGQTADINFASRAMRRIGLVHCVLAFLFNTTILALTINIAASLL